MLETITPAQMKALEARFLADNEVPPALLMEQAAHAVTEAVCRHALPGSTVLFLCGPGNNGGDGYAAARLWLMKGGKALVWAYGMPPSGDAAMNRRLLQLHGVEPANFGTHIPEETACIVDALFGTGLNRPMEREAAALVRLCNASRLPVVAVDIPSGLSGETGEALGETVHAWETVTFHRLKPGLFLRDGALYTGKVTLASISIPTQWGDVPGLRCLTEEDACSLCPPRPAVSHKGTFGRVLLVAGSRGMAGAAALCAEAAVRMGAGLTTVACPESLVPILQTLAPCAICLPLPEGGGKLQSKAAELLQEALLGADAAAVGCGLGRDKELFPLLDVLAQARCPVVWDADALHLLAETNAAPRKAEDILTPHPGEAAHLLGVTTEAILSEPLRALRVLQTRWGGCVLLKGNAAFITDGKQEALNLNGTPALAKGGSGDVLTGVLAALCAQQHRLGWDSLTTAQLGVYLHAKAGARAAKRWGDTCVTAHDTAAALRWPGDRRRENET